MKKIFLILAVVLVCGCISEESTMTGNIVAKENTVSLSIDKVDCANGNVFIRNTGIATDYDEMRFFVDGMLVHPCDVGWLKYWKSGEGNLTFPEGKIIGALIAESLSGKEVQIFYEEEFMGKYTCS